MAEAGHLRRLHNHRVGGRVRHRLFHPEEDQEAEGYRLDFEHEAQEHFHGPDIDVGHPIEFVDHFVDDAGKLGHRDSGRFIDRTRRRSRHPGSRRGHPGAGDDGLHAEQGDRW